eukprot:3959465-Pyramimonas_sp.AAC.1
MGPYPTEPMQSERFKKLDHVFLARNWLSNVTSIWKTAKGCYKRIMSYMLLILISACREQNAHAKHCSLTSRNSKERTSRTSMVKPACVHHWGVAPLCPDLGSDVS